MNQERRRRVADIAMMPSTLLRADEGKRSSDAPIITAKPLLSMKKGAAMEMEAGRRRGNRAPADGGAADCISASAAQRVMAA